MADEVIAYLVIMGAMMLMGIVVGWSLAKYDSRMKRARERQRIKARQANSANR